MVVPLALSPSVPPGLGPSNLLTAVMDPFHFHPPPSYAMLVVRAQVALNWHIAVIMRSVTTPRHGRGHGTKVTAVATRGTELTLWPKHLEIHYDKSSWKKSISKGTNSS